MKKSTAFLAFTLIFTISFLYIFVTGEIADPNKVVYFSLAALGFVSTILLFLFTDAPLPGLSEGLEKRTSLAIGTALFLMFFLIFLTIWRPYDYSRSHPEAGNKAVVETTNLIKEELKVGH